MYCILEHEKLLLLSSLMLWIGVVDYLSAFMGNNSFSKYQFRIWTFLGNSSFGMAALPIDANHRRLSLAADANATKF